MHEAVEEVEGAEPGVIVEEVQKGYSFQDKIIRVAKVKIGRYHS
jgi:molecular chaperone GrpE (heat shock protein)